MCNVCAEGFYEALAPRGGAVAADAGQPQALVCLPCLGAPGSQLAVCAQNSTLQTVRLTPGHWRLSDRSNVVSECAKVMRDGSEFSPCIGGDSAGDGGRGYCADGHQGVRCEVCSDGADGQARYFKSADAQCVDCPPLAVTVGVVGYIILGGFALYFFVTLVRRCCVRRHHQWWLRTVRRAALWVDAYALIPKAKLLITFYQSAVLIPKVYDISLPEHYYKWTQMFSLFEVDWTTLMPITCYGTYLDRLLFIGLAPLVAITTVVVVIWGTKRVVPAKPTVSNTTVSVIQALSPLKSHNADWSVADTPAKAKRVGGRRRWGDCMSSVPIALFVSFCLVSGTSSAVLRTWDCIEYEEDSAILSGACPGAPSNGRSTTCITSSRRAFLSSDLQLECWAYTSSRGHVLTSGYRRVRDVAIIFVVVWPVGLPLLYLALLLPLRRLLRERRTSRLLRATAFLHREYRPACVAWEPLVMWQRTIIVAFVQLIPPHQTYFRLLLAVAVTIVYLTLLLIYRPYKRADVEALATCMQIFLVCLLLIAHTLRTFNELDKEGMAKEILGISNVDQLIVTMVSIKLLLLAIFSSVTLYQIAHDRHLPLLRLVHSREPPDLMLGQSMDFHLFLSHVWASGQDQV